ncbi:hypothetical protein BDB01DRAFT_776175 [Pilobolus umbonatus]|nr:hypothetical protein BDB01DRAFT_776175 [Pilobolus umbonatus]
MDNKLQSLLLKYKKCSEQLTDINLKVEKVQSSEQILNSHNSQQVKTNDSKKAEENTCDNIGNLHLSDLVNKLKVNVDNTFNKIQTESNDCKSAIESYIEDCLWNLHCKNVIELGNKESDTGCVGKGDICSQGVIEHNHGNNRDNHDDEALIHSDKLMLWNIIMTLFQFEQGNNDEVVESVHQWLITVISVYLRLSNSEEKNNTLKQMVKTTNISTWAIPLLQVHEDNNKNTYINNYLDMLTIIFDSSDNQWSEDDFLAVLDQLAIDFTYNKIIESIVEYNQEDIKFIFTSSHSITHVLMKGIQRYRHMNSLLKRLSQVSTQIVQLLIDYLSDRDWIASCQPLIDSLIYELVSQFMHLEANGHAHGDGWYFLPNIPFKVVSVDTLWDITVSLLQLEDYNDKNRPLSLSLFLNVADLPNLARFEHSISEYQAQAFFMLNCLTNIVTCIPQGAHDIKNTNNVLSTCNITIIAYALFSIAFVNKNLRDVFHREVRDCFAAICEIHPIVISLLFRWTVHYINSMDRMALYLFYSLPLKNWLILKDDLKLLHQLLTQSMKINNKSKIKLAQLQFAKYIIQNLNYGYQSSGRDTSISRSQSWSIRRLPFLEYEIHEEIAFILLDACQNFQSLTDKLPSVENASKTESEKSEFNPSALIYYLPIIDQISQLKSNYISSSNWTNAEATDFINWCWKISGSLLLYDCPISSRATEIQSAIQLPFLKVILNSANEISSSHSAFLVYISFMLSATSRHFLRFDSGDGWMQLLAILKKGKPEAVIQILSEIIPSFVYMHGDDFFNNESLLDFLKHMVEFKSDPCLNKAGERVMKQKAMQDNNQEYNVDHPLNGMNLIIASNIWHASLIDSVSSLMDSTGKGFSYVDLVMHSWLKTVFMKSDWMWGSAYIEMIDLICKISFSLGRHNLVLRMLKEEERRMGSTKHPNPQANASANTTMMNSPRMITRFIKNMVTEGVYPTLLVGDWSLLNIKANTFNKSPGVEDKLFWFTFHTLLSETSNESSLRDQMAQYIMNDKHNLNSTIDISHIHKSITSIRKPLEFFSIYRWLQHIIILPLNHSLLPLFLQAFFTLYFTSITIATKGGEKKVSFGSKFFDNKPEMIHKLRDYIASAQTYYGQQITTCNNKKIPIIYAVSEELEVLQQTYYAMWLWLGNKDILTSGYDIHTLPVNYDTKRLERCMAKHGDSMMWDDPSLYWMDLIDIDRLERDFLQYRWEGSDKFRMAANNEDSISIRSNLSISPSTASRRVKFTTEASTIQPLPKSEFRKPPHLI